ncbi:hypothetical protein BDB01DRAFT_771983 [Pilobolus umbonatus]|nr:hypothetical protein BDB01DRAFT_771983 [Pilobolus umbonatus]
MIDPCQCHWIPSGHIDTPPLLVAYFFLIISILGCIPQSFIFLILLNTVIVVICIHTLNTIHTRING